MSLRLRQMSRSSSTTRFEVPPGRVMVRAPSVGEAVKSDRERAAAAQLAGHLRASPGSFPRSTG